MHAGPKFISTYALHINPRVYRVKWYTVMIGLYVYTYYITLYTVGVYSICIRYQAGTGELRLLGERQAVLITGFGAWGLGFWA